VAQLTLSNRQNCIDETLSSYKTNNNSILFVISAYPLLDYVIAVIILQYVKCDKYKRKELFNTG